jgi:hypothetical protein
MSADSPSVDRTRDDLAFMRAVVADRDPLPALYGAHLVAIGACFGPAELVAWVAYSGLAGVSEAWAGRASLSAAIIYVPLLAAILARGFRVGAYGGVSQRAVWLIWAGVGAMTLALAVGFIGASARDDLDGEQVMIMWLPALLALYGGAWTLKALLRRAPWHGIVAAGCYVASIACAWTATPSRPASQHLLAGLALLAFFAAPGLAIMLAARRRA